MRHIAGVVACGPRRGAVVLLAVVVVALLVPCGPGSAVRAVNVQYVVNGNDDAGIATDCTNPNGICTLRDALHAAASGDTVALSPGITTALTVTLTTAPLTISQSVTIQGGGLLAVDGGQTKRVFTVTGGTVEMDGMTIQNGLATDQGAGISHFGGSLTLNHCLVTNNVVYSTTPNFPAGGGIYTQSTLTLLNTTVSHNAVADTYTGPTLSGVSGGGIFIAAGTTTITGSTFTVNQSQSAPGATAQTTGGGIGNQATLVLTNSTVSDNRNVGPVSGNVGGGIINIVGSTTIINSTVTRNGAAGGAGGLYNAMTLTLTGALIAGNSAPFAPDIQGAVTGGSNSLIGDGTGTSGLLNGVNGIQVGTAAAPVDPKLDPTGLQANGSTGPQTIALLRTSPAIEAGGSCPAGVSTDERGQPRAGNCDIGAYEYQPVTPTVNSTTAPASGGSVVFGGSGFQTASHLAIGGTVLIASGGAVSGDGTQMTLTVPAHSVGVVPIAVSNPGNANPAVATLTYLPVVSAVGPASGTSGGGVPVTIRGVGFGTDPAQVSVRFGTAGATVQTVSDTQLTVTTPAGSGTVDVSVTVSGQRGTLHAAYTYGAVNAVPAPMHATIPAAGMPAAPPAATHPPVAPVAGAPTPAPAPIRRP